MCVIYPTINSAGISCVPKSEHGAIAGTFYFSHAFRRSWARLQWHNAAMLQVSPSTALCWRRRFAALLFSGLLFN
jgi:hypothetical protein